MISDVETRERQIDTAQSAHCASHRQRSQSGIVHDGALCAGHVARGLRQRRRRRATRRLRKRTTAQAVANQDRVGALRRNRRRGGICTRVRIIQRAENK